MCHSPVPRTSGQVLRHAGTASKLPAEALSRLRLSTLHVMPPNAVGVSSRFGTQTRLAVPPSSKRYERLRGGDNTAPAHIHAQHDQTCSESSSSSPGLRDW
jgi:hypothetical protein